MAITKEKKRELVVQYREWLEQSKGLIIADYLGLTTAELEELRREVREAGGEFHVVKNTLGRIAMQDAEISLPPGYLEGPTAIGYAFEDAPALAKALAEFAKRSEALKIRGGYLGKQPLSREEVTALAELPPLPVMRAQLLGTILAPATQLARVLSEPGRQLARVLQAYAEQETGAEAAV